MINLPIHLLIIIIVTALIIVLLVTIIIDTMNDYAMSQVEVEVNKILTESESMYEYADFGTIQTLKVCFPESLDFIIFGDINNEDVFNDNPFFWYYKMEDGRSKTGHSSIKFSGKNPTHIAIFRSGDHYLTLELIKQGGEIFVKIYEE